MKPWLSEKLPQLSADQFIQRLQEVGDPLRKLKDPGLSCTSINADPPTPYLYKTLNEFLGYPFNPLTSPALKGLYMTDHLRSLLKDYAKDPSLQFWITFINEHRMMDVVCTEDDLVDLCNQMPIETRDSIPVESRFSVLLNELILLLPKGIPLPNPSGLSC